MGNPIIRDTLSDIWTAGRSSVKLFLTYLTVFLVASFVAGIFLFLYSGIKTNNIATEFAVSLIATLSLTLQILTIWYLLRRDRPMKTNR